MNVKTTAKWLRWAVLAIILGYVTYDAYLHQILGGGKAASAHALCPYGALESLYTLLFMGTFIQKIYSGTVVLLILTVVIALLFRRSFCGLLCPFGALQEFFAKLGQKLFKKRLVVPTAVDKPLRYLKYVILSLTVGMAWYYGTLWMSPYDPYAAYGHLTAIQASIEENPAAIVGFVLLGITILGSFLYDRFFCKYICPMGAFYAVIGKLSPTKVERNSAACINCNLCSKACPVNIDVAKADKVTGAECLNCNECVLACPKKGALEVKTAGKAVKPLVMLIIVVSLFFGTILIAQVTGNYQVIPSALKEGQIIPISDIKGYYTIEESAVATGLSLPELYAKLGIPENVSKNTMMKEISVIAPNFNFDEAKEKAAGTGEAPTPQAVTTAPAVSADDAKVDVTLIKGSLTIRQAAETLKMDEKAFYTLFKIPESVPAQTLMKDIAAVVPGYSLDAVKASLK